MNQLYSKCGPSFGNQAIDTGIYQFVAGNLRVFKTLVLSTLESELLGVIEKGIIRKRRQRSSLRFLGQNLSNALPC